MQNVPSSSFKGSDDRNSCSISLNVSVVLMLLLFLVQCPTSTSALSSRKVCYRNIDIERLKMTITSLSITTVLMNI